MSLANRLLTNSIKRIVPSNRIPAMLSMFLIAGVATAQPAKCADTGSTRVMQMKAQQPLRASKLVLARQNAACNVRIEYPEISGLSPQKCADINKAMRQFIDAKCASQDWPDPTPDQAQWIIDGTYQVKFLNARFISVVFYFNNYFGSERGIINNVSFNYDVETGKQVSLADCIGAKLDYRVISELCRIKLFQTLDSGEEAMVLEGTDPLADNFDCWFLNERGLTFQFSQYQVAPYSAGMPEVVLSFDEFKPMLTQGSAASAVAATMEDNDLLSKLVDPQYRKSQLEIALECFAARVAER